MSNQIISTANNGSRIVSTNYWGSSLEAAGIFYISVNAGAIRLLVPRGSESAVNEMKTAKEVVVSRGMDSQNNNRDSLELLFDDHSDNPFAIFSPIDACDRWLTEEGPLSEFTVWTLKNGSPKCRITRRGVYRKVASLPYMKPASYIPCEADFHCEPSANATGTSNIASGEPADPIEPSGLIHVTLNTGHVNYAPEIDLETCRLLRPLVAAGGGAIPTREPWHVVITTVPNAGWIFDIQKGSAATFPKVIRCALGFGPEAPRLWQEIERQYFQLAEMSYPMFPGTRAFVEMPTTQPWLATLLLPELNRYLFDSLWLGSFENCMASALLKSR
jgi:hypothetical protein